MIQESLRLGCEYDSDIARAAFASLTGRCADASRNLRYAMRDKGASRGLQPAHLGTQIGIPPPDLMDSRILCRVRFHELNREMIQCLPGSFEAVTTTSESGSASWDAVED